MKQLIADFPQQMRQARDISAGATFTPHSHEIYNVVLLGLGGSAFGGEITRDYFAASCGVPFAINRDYSLPGYVSRHTLIIASSYSGNTEETLSAFEQARERGAKIVCITSGGKLLEMAKAEGLDHIVLPGGYPPRSAAGFSIVQQLTTFHGLGLAPDFSEDLEEAIDVLENFDDHDLAREVAEKMKGKLPILYTEAGFESIVIRWRQQIEENAKQLAFYHVVPEMNHNELVGWEYPPQILQNSAVVFLESNLQHPRNLTRMKINKEIIGKVAGNLTSIEPQGASKLAQLFYFLHLGDWVSLYLAELNEVDPTPVKVIDYLKGELAKL